MAKASKVVLGLQQGTTRTVYATWAWSKSHTDNYKVRWYYDTGNGVWFIGEDSTVTMKQSTYSAPENAIKVKFTVKPVSKTHKVKKKKKKKKKTVEYSVDVAYWTADWSTAKQYKFSTDQTPETPSVPTVSITKLKLTAEVNSYDTKTKEIEFQVVKNDKSVVKKGTAKVKTHHASFSCTVSAGCEYKVRCRGKGDKHTGAWSEFSQNAGTIPSGLDDITSVRFLSDTSVRIEWPAVKTATSYDVEYTTDAGFFSSSNEVQSMSVNAPTHHVEITGLEAGHKWFVRIRAVNEHGVSPWTGDHALELLFGIAPSPPTTWSSTTTAVVGETTLLYWVQNSNDGSVQTQAQIKLFITFVDGSTDEQTYTVWTGSHFDIHGNRIEETVDNIYVYNLDEILSNLYYGASIDLSDIEKIEWQVKTRGILASYSDWSVKRTIQVYSPPTLGLTLSNDFRLFQPEEERMYLHDSSGNILLDNIDDPLLSNDHFDDPFDILRVLPIYVEAEAGPSNQSAISFYLTVIANESYETVDMTGQTVLVNAGDKIFTQYFDAESNILQTVLSASNINLDNNRSYNLECMVAMASGLTASSSQDFTVEWQEDEYMPDAEIGIDEDLLSAYIRPYCEDEAGNLIPGVILSVYRREFDGSFTEIATDLQNEAETFVTDPHPALDYARYRIVAVSPDTGAVSFYDAPSYPVDEPSIIIQWDEKWSTFDASEEDEREEPNWSGSMLKLPYNVDVSDNHDPDVGLVEYIGRSHPVSYYGTQRGETATWTTEIDKEDKETLYTLRRLAIYSGDVYVREPSGSGYWAHVTVSFSQKHLDLTIPITLNITRVEGGV